MGNICCSFGANSEEVGDSLMSLGRAHVSDGAAEEYFQRAHTVYVRTFDEHHPKAVECKVNCYLFRVCEFVTVWYSRMSSAGI